MTKMIMHGCNGAMGQVITELVRDGEGLEIVAGIDVRDDGHNPYAVYPTLKACPVHADVIVDFASAKAMDALLDYVEETATPAVICTTGLSREQVGRIGRISAGAPILRSANMSLGVNTLFKLVKEAAKALADSGFDIEIVEKHHNQKADAPSGTALALAESVNEAMDGRYHFVCDRSAAGGKRDRQEIGIQSVRGGSIVGEHDVIFAGRDEVVTFSHTAYSKAIFAKGALEAARFLAGKAPGLYTMADVIDG